jgi:hypothetical protein
MASVTIDKFTVTKDVANAEIDLEYTIKWSDFDKTTNLQYQESWKVIEDDTGQDGDDAHAGDDAVNTGLIEIAVVSANGAASTKRTKSRTIAFSNLDQDVGDDEIRAVVSLAPLLPAAVSKESDVVVVNA